MTYAINRNRDTIWREGANDAETGRVEVIDHELSVIERKRAALTNERRLLINRACQRRRYETKKNSVSHEKDVDVSHTT
jgi:hypothetical protein